MATDDLSFIPPKPEKRPGVNWQQQYKNLQRKMDDVMLNNRILRQRVDLLEKVVDKVANLGVTLDDGAVVELQEFDIEFAKQLMGRNLGD